MARARPESCRLYPWTSRCSGGAFLFAKIMSALRYVPPQSTTICGSVINLKSSTQLETRLTSLTQSSPRPLKLMALHLTLNWLLFSDVGRALNLHNIHVYSSSLAA